MDLILGAPRGSASQEWQLASTIANLKAERRWRRQRRHLRQHPHPTRQRRLSNRIVHTHLDERSRTRSRMLWETCQMGRDKERAIRGGDAAASFGERFITRGKRRKKWPSGRARDGRHRGGENIAMRSSFSENEITRGGKRRKTRKRSQTWRTWRRTTSGRDGRAGWDSEGVHCRSGDIADKVVFHFPRHRR